MGDNCAENPHSKTGILLCNNIIFPRTYANFFAFIFGGFGSFFMLFHIMIQPRRFLGKDEIGIVNES